MQVDIPCPAPVFARTAAPGLRALRRRRELHPQSQAIWHSIVALGLAILALALVAATPARAERPKVGFLSPVGEPDGEELIVVTREGEELRGRIVRSMSVHESLTRLTLKLDDGSKRKLKADQIDRIYMPVDDFWRGVMVAEATTTLEEIWKADFERIFEVEELIFDSIRHPKSKRVSIRQLVNPGFDSRLQVYYLPASKEGKGGFLEVAGKSYFGDMPKAFLVVKDGADPVRVKQRAYRDEHFEELFSDCPELLERYQGDQRKFKFFAEHTFLYDQLCPGEGSPTYIESDSAE